jgi:predicted small metal-binding protein
MTLRGETEEEILMKAAEHNKSAHGMEATEEAREMMRQEVRDE